MKISRIEIIEKLKKVAPKWDNNIESALKIPDKLFILEQVPFLYFCTDSDFKIIGVLQALMTSKSLPEEMPEYGIAINETAGSVYATLVDMKRKIVVRKMICSYHNEKSGGWSELAKKINEA